MVYSGTTRMGSFSEMVERATGHVPYAYQVEIAEDGFPELLRAPTGTGKTLAASLTWLYRRRFHPDESVRAATPHWLVYVLPMRVLVEQTRDAIEQWLKHLGLDQEVAVHVVMGGEGRLESGWQTRPENDAVFVGTLDMLVSRALNRGYGSSRFAWPIDFGLFNNGCQWVFDEVQLMGPALPTSRQLEGLRRKLGTALACRSMWMSATIDSKAMETVDMPELGRVAELGDEDRSDGLAVRLEASKIIGQLVPDTKHYARSLAELIEKRHRPGTLSIAMMNTVERAKELRAALSRITSAEVVLVHSRFRPPERAAQLMAALSEVDKAGPGRIVVSTQVLEAGVDISATTMFTEAAPWPSIIQRAGRCNRAGEVADAAFLWARPPKSEPYLEVDVDASATELEQLEGKSVTSENLGGRSVAVAEELHAVLRRRDLVDLFDTTPDLSGNDIDIARFIRASDDVDVAVAWREMGAQGPDEDEPLPESDERCPVPIGEVRKAIGKSRRTAWRHDHIDEKWVPIRDAREVRPGMVLILRASDGGYEPAVGWSPVSKAPVPVGRPGRDALEADVNVGGDPMTFAPGRWVSLKRHLEDVEGQVRTLLARYSPEGLSTDHIDATIVAARMHDIGKAHEVFQDMLERSAANDEELRAGIAVGRPWAKSPQSKRVRNKRRFFRHELASALALLADGSGQLKSLSDPDLALYLVASHHGRVRLGLRSLPDESPPPGEPDRLFALGVWDGEHLPEVEFPGGRLPSTQLDLSGMALGDDSEGRWSWARRMLELRDRTDLGPFRLGFLEALVRLADWRASAAEEGQVNHD